MPLISIKLDVDDKTFQQAIKRAAKALGQLDDRPGDFVPSFDVSNLPGALRQVSTLQGALGAFGTMGLPGQFAAIGLQLGEMAWQMGEAGATTLRTEASFERLAAGVGESGQAILQAMQAASQGTVSNADLMAAANRALVLGVADSAEEMAALTEAAIIRGRDVGVSATQAVNDLVTGIGRMSPEILDNLGIANASGAFREYAAELGKTVDQLTEVEKKQALVNSVLASTEGVSLVDDAAASFERMDAALANAQEALGQLFSPAVAAVAEAVAEAIAQGATIALNAAKTPATELEQTFASLEERALVWSDVYARSLGSGFADVAAQSQTQAFRTLQFAIDAAAQALASGVPGAQSWGDTLAFVANESLRTGQVSQQNLAVLSALIPVIQGQTAAYVAQGPAIDAVTQKLLSQAQAARQAIAATAASQSAGLRSQMLGMAGDLGAGAALNQYKELNAELNTRTQLMQSWGYTAERIEFENAAWIENTTGALRAQIAEMGKLESAGVSAGRSIDSAFQSLESRVSGVLSQSLALDVGVNPADFLPREDAINENARRLAAIMRNGLGDQEWMAEFKAEVPGVFDEIAASANPQQAAAKILQEFQAGLRPELLDKDAAKERVRQMILGEQSMAALAGEIAQELAQEMGISMPEALGAAQSALGVDNAEGAGMQASFLGGLDANGIATTTTSKIAAAFKENESAIRGSGGVVGAWWGEGFMATVGANVPPGLLEMLTAKLLPMIQAATALQSSATTPDGA